MDDKTVRILTCPCGAVTEVPVDNRVKVVLENAPGWGAVLTYRGYFVYLCPECRRKAGELANELANVIGHDDPYMETLIRYHKKEL